jgi:TonB family protein
MNKKLLALGVIALLFGAINLGSRAAHSGTPRAPFEALLTPASCAQPQWPAEARRYEIEGATTIRFEIGADGKVRHAAAAQQRLAHSDEAALQGIAQCVFQPGLEARGCAPPSRCNMYGSWAAWRPSIRNWCRAVASHAGVQAFRQDDVRASGSDGVLLRFWSTRTACRRAWWRRPRMCRRPASPSHAVSAKLSFCPRWQAAWRAHGYSIRSCFVHYKLMRKTNE